MDQEVSSPVFSAPDKHHHRRPKSHTSAGRVPSPPPGKNFFETLLAYPGLTRSKNRLRRPGQWTIVEEDSFHLGDKAVQEPSVPETPERTPSPALSISKEIPFAVKMGLPSDLNISSSPQSGKLTPAPLSSPSKGHTSWFSPSGTSQGISSASGVLGEKVYRYTPLDGREFRLVKILAARKSKVKCEILHRSLDSPPPYTAVSYAWGDPADNAKIEIRDENYSTFMRVPIAKSLYYALEALREKGQDVVVWADALSIDQQNRDEKNQQLALMTDIYRKARSVAICLGPDEDDSDLATRILKDLVTADEFGAEASRAYVQDMLLIDSRGKALPALAALFEREYWKRLWVVQEVFNAVEINVYCGSSPPLPWEVYQRASNIFRRHKDDLEHLSPRRHSIVTQKRYSYSQILAYQGPGSLPDPSYLDGLLDVMRACRRMLSSDPRDKVFGVLGILDEEVREEFTVDYGNSVKDIYTDVVDYLLTTTERLDVICESINFPTYTSSHNLPTWVPDWSYIPDMSAISLSPGTKFAASKDTKADFKFLDERRNKLQISGISLGVVSWHGISAGTLCTLADYLMAFLHWRALLLGSIGSEHDERDATSLQKDFCRTLCFGQIPSEWEQKGSSAWTEASLHVFASLIKERLPYLAIDEELAKYIQVDAGISPTDRRSFLQTHFGSRMMGRCFFQTNKGQIGLGTGFMTPNDEVVVPLGCSSPILLRKEGNRGEYRFVGDVYVDGYMHGKAVNDLEGGKRYLKRYVLH